MCCIVYIAYSFRSNEFHHFLSDSNVCVTFFTCGHSECVDINMIQIMFWIADLNFFLRFFFFNFSHRIRRLRTIFNFFADRNFVLQFFTLPLKFCLILVVFFEFFVSNIRSFSMNYETTSSHKYIDIIV